jgi:hypothetical protein
LAQEDELLIVGVASGAHEESAAATVGGLEQGYVICPSDQRFLLLFTFLKRNKNKKIMVSSWRLDNSIGVLEPQLRA